MHLSTSNFLQSFFDIEKKSSKYNGRGNAGLDATPPVLRLLVHPVGTYFLSLKHKKKHCHTTIVSVAQLVAR